MRRLGPDELPSRFLEVFQLPQDHGIGLFFGDSSDQADMTIFRLIIKQHSSRNVAGGRAPPGPRIPSTRMWTFVDVKLKIARNLVGEFLFAPLSSEEVTLRIQPCV